MNNISCVRKIHFCYGHRVLGHEGKCAHMHGHNGIVWIHARTKQLDSVGRVIDFSVLKEKVGGWIDRHWDHGFIYYYKDDEMNSIFASNKHKCWYLPYNPTAENLAKYLLEKVCPLVLKDTDVEAFQIDFWETENCYATARLD